MNVSDRGWSFMADNIIFVGPKGHHLEIPNGFSIVIGPMKEGDL